MTRRVSCAALVALIVPMFAARAPAHAAVTSTASEFAIAPADEGAAISTAAQTSFASTVVLGSRYESSRYRPRRERSSGRGFWRGRGVSQLHAGFLDPDGDADPGFVVGFRGGQQIDELIQVGLGLDWRTKSGRSTEVLQQTTGPGGEIILVRRDISRYSSNLFPTMLYLQVSGPSDLGIVPYFGVAGSWQVLFLEADDFQTGARFDATYDGFGWQLWGGAALPLSGRSRLVGEVFMNQADLGRDVFDPTLGQDIRETVSTDGVGARFGLSWGF